MKCYFKLHHYCLAPLQKSGVLYTGQDLNWSLTQQPDVFRALVFFGGTFVRSLDFKPCDRSIYWYSS